MTEPDLEHEDPRCPECGARNRPDAEWCTQCYTPLRQPEPEPATEPGPAAGGVPPPPTAPTPSGSVPPPPPPPPGSGRETEGLLPLPPPPGGASSTPKRELTTEGARFRETDEGLQWACATCDTWNSMDLVTCVACGTAFGRSVGADKKPERPEIPAGVLALVSFVLPGAGHWMLGMRATALLRGVLAIVWGLGGFVLLLRGATTGGSAVPAIPLLLGYLVLAAASANDAIVEGGGRGRILLQGRMLMWLTITVTGATFGAVLLGVMSAVN